MTIHTRHFPPKGFTAITLFPFVFYNSDTLSDRNLRHETIHLWQQAFSLVLPFYLLYLVFWVTGLLRYRDTNKAYRMIPFEKSAYRLEDEREISWVRKAFDWLYCFN